MLSSVTTRTPNSEMPTVLPLAARQQAKWTNPQAAYAMTTQMSPMFQGMSLPVSTLAANEMAARVSMSTPALTPTSAAKAAKRDAKRAYLPCRLSRMTAGARRAGYRPRAQS